MGTYSRYHVVTARLESFALIDYEYRWLFNQYLCRQRKGMIFLEPKELDVVRLTDGREVSVLEVYGGDTDFYVEYQCPNKDDCEWFV